MYNVAYDGPNGPRTYCVDWMRSHSEASAMLYRFLARYTNADGTPKAYPNGKGFYAFTNIRIVTKQGD